MNHASQLFLGSPLVLDVFEAGAGLPANLWHLEQALLLSDTKAHGPSEAHASLS